MEMNWLLTMAIFAIVSFLVWRMTIGAFKKEYGEKRRKLWGQNVFYWQDVVFISTGATFLMVMFLDWAKVLTL